MSKVATIPEFVDGDARSMSVALRAMKQAVETLGGQRYDQSQGAPAVYVQTTTPSQNRNPFRVGDFWINPSTKKLSYYNGNYWEAL